VRWVSGFVFHSAENSVYSPELCSPKNEPPRSLDRDLVMDVSDLLVTLMDARDVY
jgi:hypothetical protein